MKPKMISSNALLNKLKGFFTRNLGLKIIAFIFAVLLWAYVLVALNPVRSKSIDDVPITLEGYTDLLSRNLIVVNSDLGLADVEVNATITNHADLDNSRVNCRATLGTISEAQILDDLLSGGTITDTTIDSYGTVKQTRSCLKSGGSLPHPPPPQHR